MVAGEVFVVDGAGEVVREAGAGVDFTRREVRGERTGLDVLIAYRRIAEMQSRKEKRIVFMKGRGGEGLCSPRERERWRTKVGLEGSVKFIV